MKRSKKFIALLCILSLTVGVFAGCGGSGDGDAGNNAGGDGTYTWKIQCAYPPGDQAYDLHMPMICEAITEATDGQIKFDYYIPGAICEPEQAPASVAKGILDCAISAPNDTAQIVTAAYAEQGIPFWWETGQDIYDCFYEEGLLEFLRAEYEKAGIYYGMFDPNGAYMLMTDFPVNSADDLKGKKIRSSTSYASLMEVLGAAPVSMAGGDIYMGMKLGTIDGYIYSVAELELSSLKEVSTNVMVPAGCAASPVNLIISKKAWDSLTPELQETVNATMQDMFLKLYDAAVTIDNEAREAAEAYGVQYLEVSDENMKAFNKGGEQVMNLLSEKYPAAAPGFEIIKEWKDKKEAAQQ